MHRPLEVWLTSDKQPANLYDLLGLPSFCSQAEEASVRIRQLSRDLLGLQNSSDAALAPRLHRLQSLLGQADRVFRSPAARVKYEEELLADWAVRRTDLTSLPTMGAIEQRLVQVDGVKPNDAHRIASELWRRARGSAAALAQPDAVAKHRVFGSSGRDKEATLPPTSDMPLTPIAAKAPIAVDTSTNSHGLTASAVGVLSPANKEAAAKEAAPSQILLELEPDSSSRPTLSLPLVGMGLAVALLVLLNVVVLATRFSRQGQASAAMILAREPPATPASAEPAPLAPPAAAPASPTPSPAATTPKAPGANATPSSQASPASAAWNVGSPVDVVGKLLEVQGGYVQETPEMHLRIECASGAPVSEIAAFTRAPDFATAALDYLSAQEDAEIRGVTPGQGDQVRVRGIVAAASEAALRIPSAVRATLVRLERLERVGDAASVIEIGKVARDASALRGDKLDLATRGLLRLPPKPGETVTFRAKYQEIVSPEKTWLVSLGGRLRGVELLVSDTTAPNLAAGEEVEITGAAQGLVAGRVVGNVAVVRPVLQAVSIRNSKSNAPIVSSAVPATPVGNAAPTLPSTTAPTTVAEPSPAAATPPAAPNTTANNVAEPSAAAANNPANNATVASANSKDRLSVDPPGPAKPFSVLLGMQRLAVQNRLGVSALSVPFKTGEAARRADAYVGEGTRGNQQLNVVIYNSQERVIYLDAKPLPAGSQLAAVSQLLQEALENFANSTAALTP